MTAKQHTRTEAADLVDALSSPRNEVHRADLTIVKLREAAIDAAQEGLCDVELGHHANAAGSVACVADELLIVSATDLTLDGRARQGARDGIASAWTGDQVQPPNLDGAEGDCYTIARAAAYMVVAKVLDEEKQRQDKVRAR